MSTEGVDCETMTNLNDSPATAFRLSENFQTNSSQRAKPPVMSEPAALPSSSNLRRLRYGGRWVVEPAGEAGWKYASPLHPGADRTPGPTENPSAGKVALTADFLSSKTPKSSICSQSREFRQQSRRCRADRSRPRIERRSLRSRPGKHIAPALGHKLHCWAFEF
jgi:hypothetical protein